MLLVVLFLLVLVNLLVLLVLASVRKNKNVADATFDRLVEETDYFTRRLATIEVSLESLDGLVEDQSFKLLALTKPQPESKIPKKKDSKKVSKR